MQQRSIGVITVIIAVLLLVALWYHDYRSDKQLDAIIASQGGSCYLADGTCLHDLQKENTLIIPWILAGSALVLGVYLVFFDKMYLVLAQQQQVAREITKARREDRDKDEFKAFLAAFNDEEQRVLRTLREEEGITQSTLRYKTNLSKAMLSIMLKNLEQKGFVKRVPKGKTNKVFLVRKF